MKLEYIIKTIEKDLEERTVKHPVTEHARYLGSTGTVETTRHQYKTEDGYTDEYDIDTVTYKDGTQIIYYDDQIGAIVSPDGELVPYLDNHSIQAFDKESGVKENQGTEFFKENQGDVVEKLSGEKKEYYEHILKNFLDNEWEYGPDGGDITEISDLIRHWETNKGETILNGYVTSEYEDDLPDIEGYMDFALDEFPNIVKENSFTDTDNFMTMKPYKNGLPEGKGVDKRIVSNDDYQIEYSSAEAFTVKKQLTSDGWTVCTLHEKGNPADHGVDLDRVGEWDSEGRFMTAPGQKYERYLIDEKRKIIIQRPYQPGMEQHIWG